tara:strand:- start:1314 stop:1940 length:627 start_codon:yes stop_codon:yes gene_type:complete
MPRKTRRKSRKRRGGSTLGKRTRREYETGITSSDSDSSGDESRPRTTGVFHIFRHFDFAKPQGTPAQERRKKQKEERRKKKKQQEQQQQMEIEGGRKRKKRRKSRRKKRRKSRRKSRRRRKRRGGSIYGVYGKALDKPQEYTFDDIKHKGIRHIWEATEVPEMYQVQDPYGFEAFKPTAGEEKDWETIIPQEKSPKRNKKKKKKKKRR